MANSVCMSSGQANAEISVDRAPTLNCLHEAPVVAFKPSHYTRGKDGAPNEVAPPLSADADKGDQDTVLAVRTANTSANGHGISEGVAHTLDQAQGQAVAFVHQAGGAQTTLGYDPESGTAPVSGRCQTPAIAYCPEASATLVGCSSRGGGQTNSPGHNADQQVVAFAQNQRDEVRTMDVAGALAAEAGAKQQTYVAFPIDTQNMTEGHASGGKGYGDHGDHGDHGDPSFTITKGHNHAVAFEARIARNGRGAPSDVVPPLKAQSGQSGKGDAAPLVAFEATRDCAGTMMSYSKSGGDSNRIDNAAAGYMAVEPATMQVRRLTPMECERLQGFPDGYTLIPIPRPQMFEGQQVVVKMSADGPRYKALGNSMAVPVMHWIGRRIDFVSKLEGGGK